MTKKLWLLLMPLVLALALAACGGGEVSETAVPETAPTEAAAAPTEAPAEAPTEEAVSDVSAEADTSGSEAIRSAIVMPSTVTDLAWSQSIYDALVRIQEQAGGPDVVEIAYTENMFNVTDAAAAIRDYADSGYNLILAHGAQYGTSLFEIAPDFP